MFTAALFIIANIQRQPKYPSKDEWIKKKMLDVNTMEYYSAIKKNEILPFAKTWMDLEGIVLPPNDHPCLKNSLVAQMVESASKAGDPGSIPPGGKYPQYTCLENPMDRGTWRAMVHGVSKRYDSKRYG